MLYLWRNGVVCTDSMETLADRVVEVLARANALKAEKLKKFITKRSLSQWTSRKTFVRGLPDRSYKV